jgi:hypothetical protein
VERPKSRTLHVASRNAVHRAWSRQEGKKDIDNVFFFGKSFKALHWFLK